MTAQEFAAEVDRQIVEYGCVSDEAIEKVSDDLRYNHGMTVEEVDVLAWNHFNYRQVAS